MSDESAAARLMQCMEVWGGNQAVDSGVIMSGLDAWAYSRPWRGEARGGDVHFVSSCATGRISRVLLADVSGHGEAVADIAAALRLLMRRHVNHLDQARFIASLNEEFAALSDDGGFATAIAATFFAPTNYITISNAGHPPPLLYRARRREWSLIRPVERSERRDVNIPLGVLDLSEYEQHALKLAVGDLVLFYSDSLIECAGGDGQHLGPDGLIRIVNELDATSPQRLIGSLLERIAALAPGNLEHDDVTILMFRPNGLAPRVTWGQLFRATWLLARNWVKTVRRGGEEVRAMPDLTLPSIGGAMFNPFNRLWGRSVPADEPPAPTVSPSTPAKSAQTD